MSIINNVYVIAGIECNVLAIGKAIIKESMAPPTKSNPNSVWLLVETKATLFIFQSTLHINSIIKDVISA